MSKLSPMKLSHLRRPAFSAPTLTLGLGLLACAFVSSLIAADTYTFTRINIPNAVEVYGQGINNRGYVGQERAKELTHCPRIACPR
jgi:hypothetical protein